jgi:ubiquinone/menaquinone biosynthesis C-methylase UbiE
MPVLTAEDYTVSLQRFEIWECGHCTIRFTQNVPDAGEIGTYYQSENYISHSDTKEGIVNKVYHKVRIHTLSQKRKLVENETGITGGSILDVGCGTGAFLHTMDKAGWKITGLEPDEGARKKALEIYRLHLSNSEELSSLDDGSFDAITMWHVLEHVYELHASVIRLRALLKPGGKLFIAVPNYTSYDEKIYRQYWAAYDVPRHLYHFSPASMNILLSLHGMQLNSTKPMWYDSFYVSMLSEKYKTGKAHFLKALITGGISNCKAIFNQKKCSSVIYVASPNPPSR